MSVPTVRERPILFSGPMVKALLAGTKTQTRRVMRPQPERDSHGLWTGLGMGGYFAEHVFGPCALKLGTPCPHGVPGDHLWVRETWQCYVVGKNDLLAPTPRPALCSIGYAATEDTRVGTASDFARYEGPWRPSIFMPRWASRLTLEITDVRVQRLQEITEEDARAEGMPGEPGDWHVAKAAFAEGWNSI